MGFKIILLLAFATQTLAAVLALRLNFRYRIYSAWFFVSAAASVSAIMRLTTLFETWEAAPTMENDLSLWTTAIASLLASVLLAAGMSLIEPFFKEVARAQETLRREHRLLTTVVRETEDEMRLAQRIQKQLLPAASPRLPGLDLHGASEPAVWTGGDYFDYLPLQGGGTAVVIADVCGHGLGPALLMSSTRASFRALASRTADLGELLTGANQAVADAVAGKGFVTAFAANYDPDQRVLRYAAAGHPGYLLKVDGSSRLLEGEAPPLGVLQDVEIASSKAVVESGDVLVLVTDGIVETRNVRQEMFGEQRLLSTVNAYRQCPASDIVAALFAASQIFAGNHAPDDDITAVVVKFA